MTEQARGHTPSLFSSVAPVSSLAGADVSGLSEKLEFQKAKTSTGEKR
jgi:hypothetical protein